MRPGPRRGNRSSGNASTRSAVTLGIPLASEILYVSLLVWSPLASTESSGSTVSVGTSLRAESGLSNVQRTARGDSAASQALNRRFK